MSRPRCPFCGKRIPAWGEKVHAPKEPHSYVPIAGWRYDGNLPVIARGYADVLIRPDGRTVYWTRDIEWHGSEVEREGIRERRLAWVSTWDGESYAYSPWPFCSSTCARGFAIAAYRDGWRINSDALRTT